MQNPKKTSKVRNRSNQLKLETQTSNEQNAQAQKKLYHKIRSMPSKSAASTVCSSDSKQNVIYTNLSTKV